MLKTLAKAAIWFLMGAAVLQADISVLLEEPYGTFGGMNPTGHAAIYLSRVCAQTPTVLRLCRPGELGVVVSRYHRVGGYDWIAIPLIPYLYAVENPEQVPSWATPEEVDSLRDRYRRSHLESVAPDGSGGSLPRGDWTQLVGEAYERTIYAFRVQTTKQQDEQLIRMLNDGRNRCDFHLIYRNCADFVRRAVDLYYPNAIRRNFSSDLGIMTPKQAAKRLVAYSKKHPELQLTLLMIPQVAGTIPRSGPVRGVLESLLESKRYVVPLALLSILHPAVGGGLACAWADGLHFDPRRLAAAHGELVMKPATAGGLEIDWKAAESRAGTP